jgi:dihydrofolate reductase
MRRPTNLSTAERYDKREGVKMMRKLIVQQWVTLDNIAAEEDGGLSFVSAEPFDDTSSHPFRDSVMGLIDSVDTMILGANTYTQNKDYWPYAEEQGEYGRRLNALTKYVASTRLDQAPWGDFPAATVTSDPATTIRELKQQDGKDLWLWGSLTLMQSLLEADLVDEVRLLVCPATPGAGRRVFEDRHDLALVEATGFDTGVVLLRYEVNS